VSIIAIGKRGHDFFTRRNFQVIGNQNELFNNLNFENVSEITESVMEQYKLGEIDRVEVVYNQFRNAAVQLLTTEQILPLAAEKDENKDTVELDYIIEPSKEAIIEELIPKAIKIQLYKAILDSNASEHGARMTAMDKATENAGDMLRQLKLSYNQARQAAITTELTEIVSGAAALSGG
ncbi:MAG: ATP synthase F1 subunit gamma, partial [Sphingobacterium sp.]